MPCSRAPLLGLVTIAASALVACGDDGATDATGSGGAGGTTSTSAQSGATPSSSGTTGDGDGDGDGGADGEGGGGGGGAGGGGAGGGAQVGTCSQGADGIWGTAETSFTFPPPNPDGSLYHPDVQSSFPDVAWDTIDRLYIPAGTYKSIRIGNLPQRDAASPLVITNQGGQVRVGGMNANYNVVLSGGSNWVFTGRYDPVSGTGDAGYVGHRACAYGSARGNYGIWVDGAYDAAPHGVAVAGEYATDFELDFVEVERVSFAGIMLKTDDVGDATMRNVKVHDTYVHDTESEGMYIGSTQSAPQHAFENLELYNNRILRTGTESFQIGQLGDGCEIHHNVFAMGALAWKNPFSSYQDGGAQIGVRYGSIDVHHNIIIGAAGTLLPFFLQPRDGDTHTAGDLVQFRDNYLSETRSLGGYIFPDYDGVTEYRFERNTWRALEYSYDEIAPDDQEPGEVLRTFNVDAPITFTDNTWDSARDFVNGLPTGEGTSNGGNLSGSGNVRASVAAVELVDFMGWPAGTDYFRLEVWTDISPPNGGAEVFYEPGDYVMYDGDLYEMVGAEAVTGLVPPENPEVWELKADPVDDVRLSAGSPHQGIGLLDTTE